MCCDVPIQMVAITANMLTRPILADHLTTCREKSARFIVLSYHRASCAATRLDYPIVTAVRSSQKSLAIRHLRSGVKVWPTKTTKATTKTIRSFFIVYFNLLPAPRLRTRSRQHRVTTSPGLVEQVWRLHCTPVAQHLCADRQAQLFVSFVQCRIFALALQRFN
jgi:hypothetical protein